MIAVEIVVSIGSLKYRGSIGDDHCRDSIGSLKYNSSIGDDCCRD